MEKHVIFREGCWKQRYTRGGEQEHMGKHFKASATTRLPFLPPDHYFRTYILQAISSEIDEIPLEDPYSKRR
jgi:hypothetical protein